MRDLARLRTRLLPLALLGALPTFALAQPERPLPRGWAAFFAIGGSAIPGDTPLRMASSAGSLGVAYERPFAERLTWRAELGYGATHADAGPAPSEFADESLLQVPRVHVGGSVRRYSARRAWVSGGLNVALQQECYVDVSGGIAFGGVYSVDCPDYADLDVESARAAANLMIGAGFERGRFGFAVRAEQAITPTVRVNGEGQRAYMIGAEIQYRFGHEARGTEAPPRGKRASAPIAGQLAAGTTGWALGAIAGLLIGNQMAASEGDWGTPLLGAFIGAPIGTTIAIHGFGRSRGLRSNIALTFGGALAGMFGGPAMWVTSPLAASIAYNTVSRERISPSVP